MKGIKKNRAHRALMRRKHCCPMLFSVIAERPEYLIVYNRLTGRFAVLYK